MDTQMETLELLKKIEKTSRQKLVMTRIACVLLLIITVGCLVLMGMLLRMMPQLQEILDQVHIVLENLETVSRELTELDLESVVTNLDALAVYAQQSLAQTMEKLNAIDFETLNKAIEDLAKVIKPLANFASVFG